MKYLVLLFTLVFVSGPAMAKGSPLIGTSTMNIYLGSKHFPDKVVIKKDKSGKLYGTLTVPKAFTANLEKIDIQDSKFSFEIEADEGRGKFRVRYSGELHPTGKVYIGYAHLVPSGKLLGGFVGQIH